MFEPTDPNSWFLYILVYKSIASQSACITILQIITTQRNLLLYSPFYINTDPMVYSNRRAIYYVRNVTTAFFVLGKPTVWFKMFAHVLTWVLNLTCVQSCLTCVTLVNCAKQQFSFIMKDWRIKAFTITSVHLVFILIIITDT